MASVKILPQEMVETSTPPKTNYSTTNNPYANFPSPSPDAVKAAQGGTYAKLSQVDVSVKYQNKPGGPITIYPITDHHKAYNRMREYDSIFMSQKKLYIPGFWSCCYSGTKFNINEINDEGFKEDRKIFKAHDFPLWCCVCCPKIEGMIKHQTGPHNDLTAFKYEMPYVCLPKGICKLWCKRSLEMNYVEDDKKEYLGKSVEHCECADCSCCFIKADVLGPSDETLYTVGQTKWQCGYCFPHCPFDTCQEIELDIANPTGDNLGKVVRRKPGWRSPQVSYKVDLPEQLKDEDKQLILGATMLLGRTAF